MEWSRGGSVVTDDRAALDAEAVYAFLSGTYWARGMQRETCLRGLQNSLCLVLLHEGRLAGFCRAVTDRATFAYLGDVFVLPEHRGRGLAKWMVGCALAHPELQGLRRVMLATSNAHGLYGQLGFVPLAQPELFMEMHRPYAVQPPGGAADDESEAQTGGGSARQ